MEALTCGELVFVCDDGVVLCLVLCLVFVLALQFALVIHLLGEVRRVG